MPVWYSKIDFSTGLAVRYYSMDLVSDHLPKGETLTSGRLLGTSRDDPKGRPAEFFFCIFIKYLCPPRIRTVNWCLIVMTLQYVWNYVTSLRSWWASTTFGWAIYGVSNLINIFMNWIGNSFFLLIDIMVIYYGGRKNILETWLWSRHNLIKLVIFLVPILDKSGCAQVGRANQQG